MINALGLLRTQTGETIPNEKISQLILANMATFVQDGKLSHRQIMQVYAVRSAASFIDLRALHLAFTRAFVSKLKTFADMHKAQVPESAPASSAPASSAATVAVTYTSKVSAPLSSAVLLFLISPSEWQQSTIKADSSDVLSIDLLN